jgi:4-alpha-glucanotransferase
MALEVADLRCESLLIVAPRGVYGERAEEREKAWGVFLPLHALHRDASPSAGDFSDLQALMRWTAEQGGSLVATLPLLATLWELTDDPSPYNPTSRLFGNEFYLDPREIPELADTAEAQALLAAHDGRLETGRETQMGRWVDYQEQMRFKRSVLEALCRRFFEGPAPRRDALARHCLENPDLEHFARFRAVGERQGKPWPEWPEPLRGGAISHGDYDEGAYRYHLYTQWQVDEQLTRMTAEAQRLNMLWYLDFPLGVSGAGYDVWCEPELFVNRASAGAPPDAFFTKGQNWGFPPLHPGTLRRQGYRYFIKALRNHMRRAKLLRLDHVMGLYRSYWIPHGLEACDGVYVRYPIEEFFAILAVESHRFRARIVGENLGTVPAVVDEALNQRGVDGMYVLQYETNPDKRSTLRPIPAASVASVNTHDMPPFASYWEGLDIDDRVALGLLTREEAATEHARRATVRHDLIALLRREEILKSEGEPQALEVLEACQGLLARSPAGLVLVNLEDLWGESEPQNVPGTYRERPNWRRKARYSFESFRNLPVVLRILNTVNQLRRQASIDSEG